MVARICREFFRDPHKQDFGTGQCSGRILKGCVLSSFKEIEQDIKSGDVDGRRVVLLCGSEAFLTNFYEKRLTDRFGGGAPSPFDFNVFQGGEATDDAIMGACETFPMLAPKRVVVVRSHPGLSGAAGGKANSKSGAGAKASSKPRASGKAGKAGKESTLPKTLEESLAALPDTTRLILTAGVPGKTKTLYKAAAKAGKVYEFGRLAETELWSFVGKRFKKAGMEIMPSLLEEFIAATGYFERDSRTDLYNVDGEAQKIVLYAQSEGRSAVTREDLEACMGANLQTDVFALLDAVSAGKKAEAVRMLESRLESGESVFALLPRITDQFETMLGYREMKEHGYSSQKMLELLPVRQEWQLKKLGGFAGRFTTEKLYEALHRLYGIETEIKSGNIPEKLALTLFVAEL
jgi:DNA polymerase-3 subunit delta